MNTTRRITVSALAVGAALAGVFPASAHAAGDQFIGLSYSFESGIPGLAVRPTADDARIASLADCQDKGGNHCTAFAVEKNTCAALAILGQQEWFAATGATRKDAENQALAQNPGSHIAVSGCASGTPWKNPLQVPQAPLETFLEPLRISGPA